MSYFFYPIFIWFSCNLNTCFCDYAHKYQVSFQDPGTPVMEGIIVLHHDLLFVLTIIGVSVSWILFRTAFLFHNKNNKFPSKISHGSTIEIIWTVTPSLILMILAIPSFALLYSMDEIIDPSVTLKVIGHQWFWSYEYSDYSNEDNENNIMFDSYMIPNEDLTEGQLRLLEVDNPVVLPVKTHVRVLITAADVLHCWAIPSLGVKIDACPGRLNQISLFIKREGTFYGQCSEICGINHGFMPIMIDSVSIERYIKWVFFQIESETWLNNKINEIKS
uniref:Cytochrome c oxidase subunit 2 n=1 Tax=Storeatula sp. CCMP1868 TaxID=195070 RepID=A0A2P1G879_9CRYP|nr:cytochrome c oxidase subunit 2 [Storeatula sp. CCMP1868]AVM81164.1 cytochrome c oxidase subunit 2 [Storeatula sp. CCMP1868]